MDDIKFPTEMKPQKTEPDADSFKLFAGQIPHSWTEKDCKKLFEEFGPVHSLNILRDRSSKASKGCCFVMYYHRKDALNAQNSLHNIRVISGAQNAMQVKPADCEAQRKLFIGMLDKSMTEDDVKALFKEFGKIMDCIVLKDNEGKSRGCAFLTFVSHNCAQLAIRKMHQALTLKNCTKALVVKFADTPKDRERKIQSSTSNANSSMNQLLEQANSAVTILSQLIQGHQSSQNTIANQQNSQTKQLLSGLTTLLPLLNSISVPSTTPAFPPAHTGQLQQPQNSCISAVMAQVEAFLNAKNCDSNASSSSSTSHLPLSRNKSTSSASTNCSPTDQEVQTLLSAYGESYESLMESDAFTSKNFSKSGGGQLKGPDGCNLFVYHLPQSMVDCELKTLFSLFGKVVSATVFVNNNTGESKCFGFVSFDDLASAQKAILNMNGFQIGSKRLKVQMKREKEKPYQR